MRNQTILVDINKETCKILKYKQYDNNNILQIIVEENYKKINLNEYVGFAFFELPSGLIIKKECEIEDNVITIIIDNNILSEKGKVLLDLTLSDGEDTFTLFRINLVIEETIDRDEAIIIEAGWDIVAEIAKFDKAEEQRVTNEERRVDYESVRIANEADRQNEEMKRIANENVRVVKEDERLINEELRRTEEKERLTGEQVRVKAENIRIANENERLRKEIERQNAEELRQVVYDSLNGRMDEAEDRLDAVDSQLTHNTNLINVKEFGAVGDGLTDDTQAIKSCVEYAQLYNKTVYIPEEYLITETINIDISKTRIVGNGGSSKLIIKPNSKGFIGDSAIRLYNTQSWEQRCDRMLTIGHFNIEDREKTKLKNGLEIGGIGEFEGHVETLEVNEMFIIGCKSAQVINSHVYKIVTNRLYTRECDYGINFPSGTSDIGEVPVWNYCFFCDGTINFEIIGDAIFNNCSIHPCIQENKSSITVNNGKILFNACHFEVISNNKMSFYGEPWITTTGGENSINFDNCTATFTGTGDLKFKRSFIETTQRYDIVSMNGGKWHNFFKAFRFEDIGCLVNSLNGGTSYTRNLTTNVVANEGAIPLPSNTCIYKDYNFENSTKDDIDNLFFKYSDKVSFNIVDSDFSTHGGKCVEVTVNNANDYEDLYTTIGVEFEGDKLSNNTVIFHTRVKLSNGNELQINDTCFQVFDRYGKKLDDSYIQEINGNVVFYNNYGSDTLKNDCYMTYRRLPREAYKIKLGFVLVGKPYTENKCLIDYFAFDLLNNS